MAKAYWITFYHEIHNAKNLADYGAIAGPAIAQAGGKFLARGMPSAVKEGGKLERTVLIEFDSLEHALATYASENYKLAVKALGENSVVRDIRIIEGV
jgi:uncharacterized protein (DUF1330 family)